MSELRVGIVGLGSAAALVLPYFDKVPGVRVSGAADTRMEARDAFRRRYNLPSFDSIGALCRSSDVDVVWIETPNHLHCLHALEAIRHGKHVICAKPVGTTLEECDRMINAADQAGVQLLQGHSKVLDTPIHAIKELVARGTLGRVIQVDTWMFHDWLQRPRLEEELDPTRGGGIVLRQGPHQIDILRYIAGGRATSLRATAGRWDPHFATEGNYSVLMEFAGGVSATASLNGYGYFDVSELTWGIGSMGDQRPGRTQTQTPKPRRTGPLEPSEKYGSAAADIPAFSRKPGAKMPFFGLTIVSCERGVIRQSPDGLYVYTETGCEEIVTPPPLGRAAELLEMKAALAEGRSVFPDGRWGKATLEACLAILQSSASRRDVQLLHQTAPP
jgi:phthalate 4,5-cis-dihydrodiol dehydrogenase